jgi:acyl-CoA synthetase (AMP-forming)/AMP-acid ligase II
MDLTTQLREDGEMVTQRLGHWARIAGDRPFFHYGEDGVTLTYADFARCTDVIAGNLAAHGVAQGDRVSVFCANPMVSALAMFGTWKAGALYCPVNFAFTGRLLAYQLTDTAPRLIVTEPPPAARPQRGRRLAARQPPGRRVRDPARGTRSRPRAGRLNSARAPVGGAGRRRGRPAGPCRLR